MDEFNAWELFAAWAAAERKLSGGRPPVLGMSDLLAVQREARARKLATRADVDAAREALRAAEERYRAASWVSECADEELCRVNAEGRT